MDDDIRRLIEDDEKKVKREEELMNDCRLNAYQLSLAVEQVQKLKETRKELFTTMREADFTISEIAELAGVSTAHVFNETKKPKFS